MASIDQLKKYFKDGETNSLSNDIAGYQFVRRENGVMFQYSEGKYKFYKTFNGFLKAVLWRIKRG